MRAVIFRQHGDPEVLEYAEFPKPEPGPGEVQVRLRAAALNHVDLFVRTGWPGLRLELPHILGSDGAGEVSELGEGVTEFSVGDRVVLNANLSCGGCDYCLSGQDNMCRDWHLLGETVRGTYAEHVVVPARNLLPLPEGFDFAEAAAASLVFLTAWHSLISRGKLKAGETVLVVGASGGVNTASIQVAKLAGAEVYVVGSNDEKLGLAESLGASKLINRAEEPEWSRAVYQASAKRGVDVVVDNVGAGSLPLSMRAARKGGRILTVGNTAGAKFEFDNRYMFGKHLTLIGSTMGTHADFRKAMQLVFERRLKPVLDRAYALDQAQAAHIRLAAGEQMGKIVLEI